MTKEQAFGFAARRSGCKWEAAEDALAAVDLWPCHWPVPLSREGVAATPRGRIARSGCDGGPSGGVLTSGNAAVHGSMGGITLPAMVAAVAMRGAASGVAAQVTRYAAVVLHVFPSRVCL